VSVDLEHKKAHQQEQYDRPALKRQKTIAVTSPTRSVSLKDAFDAKAITGLVTLNSHMVAKLNEQAEKQQQQQIKKGGKRAQQLVTDYLAKHDNIEQTLKDTLSGGDKDAS